MDEGDIEALGMGGPGMSGGAVGDGACRQRTWAGARGQVGDDDIANMEAQVRPSNVGSSEAGGGGGAAVCTYIYACSTRCSCR